MGKHRTVHVYVSDRPTVELSSFVVFDRSDTSVTLSINVSQVTNFRQGVWSLEMERNSWQYTTVLDNQIVESSGVFFWLVRPELINRAGQVKFLVKHYITPQNVVTREFRMFCSSEDLFGLDNCPTHHHHPGSPPHASAPPEMALEPWPGHSVGAAGSSHHHSPLPAYVAYQRTLGEMQTVMGQVSNLHREIVFSSHQMKELYGSVRYMYELLLKNGNKVVFLRKGELLPPDEGEPGKLYIAMDMYAGYLKLFTYVAALGGWREVGYQVNASGDSTDEPPDPGEGTVSGKGERHGHGRHGRRPGAVPLSDIVGLF